MVFGALPPVITSYSIHYTKLYDLFHIEDFVEDESGFKISKPLKNAEEVSKKLVKIRSIANYLGIVHKEPVVQKTDSVLRDLDSKLDELDKAIASKTEAIAQLDNELKDLDSQNRITSYNVCYTKLLRTVSLSRIFIGVHYPSDVIVGAFIGCLVGFFWLYVEKILIKYGLFGNSPEPLEGSENGFFDQTLQQP